MRAHITTFRGCLRARVPDVARWRMTEFPTVHKKPHRLNKRWGFICALDRIRTYDLLLRRQTLYPLSYEGNPGILPLLAGRPRA
jgi:hypothetical protein